jgi:hypothetical protein
MRLSICLPSLKETTYRKSDQRMICVLREDLSELIENTGVLVEVLYELIRGLFAHNSPNNHLPLSMLVRVATTKRSSKKHHSNSREQYSTVCTTLLSCPIKRLQIRSDIAL